MSGFLGGQSYRSGPQSASPRQISWRTGETVIGRARTVRKLLEKLDLAPVRGLRPAPS